jgi:hypothetical protein
MILAIALLLPTGYALAQTPQEDQAREKAAQEEEIRIRKEMLEEQKQEMKIMEEQFSQQARSHVDHSREQLGRAMSSFYTSGMVPDEPFFIGEPFQGNHSQLTLRNSFTGGSDTSKGEFEVRPETRLFRCQIIGKVSSGEIYIKVEYPGGKIFKELTINSSAEINYSQSLTFKEGEEKLYSGSWKYEVRATQAEGNYILQISTN